VTGELNGRRVRESTKLRDWQRAVRKLAAMESPGAHQPKPLSQAIEAFHQAADLAPSTVIKYRRVLSNLADLAARRGIRDVEEITVEDLDALRAERKICALTWTKEVEIYRQFFRFCIDRDWTEKNPATRIVLPRNIKPTEKEPYTVEETIRILAACDAMGRTGYERARARAMVLLLRYTALRVSDVALLEKGRVRNGEIHVRTLKTGKAVWLPVHPELRAALETLPEPRGADGSSGYFFWSGNGAPESAVRDVKRTLAAVFRKSGVVGAHPHRYRHTLASELLAAGWNFEDAADILGNSPAMVRKHYAKWSRGRQDRIAEVMRSIFRGTNLVHDANRASKGFKNQEDGLVDLVRFELTTSSMPWKRAPNCATGPR